MSISRDLDLQIRTSLRNLLVEMAPLVEDPLPDIRQQRLLLIGRELLQKMLPAVIENYEEFEDCSEEDISASIGSITRDFAKIFKEETGVSL